MINKLRMMEVLVKKGPFLCVSGIPVVGEQDRCCLLLN